MDNEEFVMDASASSSARDEAPAKLTLLDRLREVIEAEVVKPDIEIKVPDRPGVSVVFSPNLDQATVTSLRNKAGAKSRNGMDILKFSGLVIAHTTKAILFDGEEVTDEDGNPLTFASQVILDMVEDDRPWPGVKKFWGSDPHLQATALKILDAAGWGDEAEEVEDDESPLAL